VIDETGQIATGKLVFSTKAWEQLLGRTPEQFAQAEIELLRYLETRLLFLRYNLGFGWCARAVEEEGNEGGDGNDGADEECMTGKKRSRDCDVAKKGIGPDFLSTDSVGEVGRLCIWCVQV
jgi:hypothetical protein